MPKLSTTYDDIPNFVFLSLILSFLYFLLLGYGWSNSALLVRFYLQVRLAPPPKDASLLIYLLIFTVWVELINFVYPSMISWPLR